MFIYFVTAHAAVCSTVKKAFQSLPCSAVDTAESPARRQQEKRSIVGVAGVGAEEVRCGQAAKPVCNVLVGGKPSPTDLLSTVLATLCREFQSNVL